MIVTNAAITVKHLFAEFIRFTYLVEGYGNAA